MKSLLFFIKKLQPYRLQLLFGLLLSLTLALSSIALLSLSGWFISSAAFAGLTVITAANFNYFIPAASIRLLAFIRILSRYFDRVINHDITFRLLANLRVWFYEQLIPLAPVTLTAHHSGDLLNRMVNDIDTLDQLYLNTLSPFLISCCITVASTLFLAYFSDVLSLLVLGMIVLSLTFISLITLSKTKTIGHNIQQSTALLRTRIIDFIQGFTDFLLFIKKENRLQAIHNASKQLADAQKKLASLKGFAMSSMQLLSGVTIFLLLILGIPLVNKQTMNGAELTMIVLLVIAAFEQLSALPLAFLSLGKTMRAADRVMDVTQQTPAVTYNPIVSGDGIHDTEDSRQNTIKMNTDITCKNLAFKYPNKSHFIFQDFNCHIPAGKKCGIAGPSGSGKSTLTYLLARIWDPVSGDIFIGNRNIKTLAEVELRQTISLVTQHIHIFNASVRDNVTLMRDDITDMHCFDVLEKVELAELIRSLPDGLNTMMGEFGKNFSGGQIRRIAIARALLLNTPIIMLDEPSAGLENTLMERIWKNCKPLFENKTVIVMTHDEALLAMMDRVIKLN